MRRFNRLNRRQRAQRRFFNSVYEARRWNELLEPGSTDSGAENYFPEDQAQHREVEHRVLNQDDLENLAAPAAEPQAQEPDVPPALDDTYAADQGQIHAWDDSVHWEPFDPAYLQDVIVEHLPPREANSCEDAQDGQNAAETDEPLTNVSALKPAYDLWFPEGYKTPVTIEDWEKFCLDYNVDEVTPPSLPTPPQLTKMPNWGIDHDATPPYESSSDPLSGELFTRMFTEDSSDKLAGFRQLFEHTIPTCEIPSLEGISSFAGERASFARLNEPSSTSLNPSTSRSELIEGQKTSFAKKIPGRRIILRTFRGLPSPQNLQFSDSYLEDETRYTWCTAEQIQTPAPKTFGEAINIVDRAYQADIANLILFKNEMDREDACIFIETTSAVVACGNGLVLQK